MAGRRSGLAEVERRTGLAQKRPAGVLADGAECNGLRLLRVFALPAKASGRRAPNLTGAAMGFRRPPPHTRGKMGGGVLDVTGVGGYSFAFPQ